jgi:hypothetical protein
MIVIGLLLWDPRADLLLRHGAAGKGDESVLFFLDLSSSSRPGAPNLLWYREGMSVSGTGLIISC